VSVNACRKYVLNATAFEKSSRICRPVLFYFGQPPGGFFFASDFLTASRQLPLSFRTSGFGPGALRGLSLPRFGLFVIVYISDFAVFFWISSNCLSNSTRWNLSDTWLPSLGFDR
jgi:hypothetical protein